MNRSSAHRFYLPDGAFTDVGGTLQLLDREAHHASDVLRLRGGDELTILDGKGSRLTCEIISVGRSRLELLVKEKNFAPSNSCLITLLTAIPKGKIESIIEKATELGASRIIPLLTERTVVQLDPSSSAVKVEKWRNIAIDAIKQCGSPWLPKIEIPVTPAQYIARGEKIDLPLVASLRPDSKSPRAIFQEYEARHHQKPVSVSVWVGPEGDFTTEELDLIQAAGAQPLTLGPLVLRADTAVIACLAVVNHELQH